MNYHVELISTKEKDQLLQTYEHLLLYTCKSQIYGCCIKLSTDVHQIKDMWEDNFYSADENIAHMDLVVISQPNQPLTVKYDPYAKTSFSINVNYCGWVKSIALEVAGDVLEDEHRIYSVHGQQ